MQILAEWMCGIMTLDFRSSVHFSCRYVDGAVPGAALGNAVTKPCIVVWREQVGWMITVYMQLDYPSIHPYLST